jgi:limonene-1,2-epoxide hydrolase
MTALNTVNTFVKAAAARDYGTALALLTDDVEYHNVPLPPVYGPAAVKETLEMLLGAATDAEWIVHREVVNGNTVMNERTDRFEVAGRWIDLPVAGVFELRDGKIALWRDYFDLATIMTPLAELHALEG